MNNKKKYLGKLSFLCGLLFCLLLGFSSTTCYADVSSDYIAYSINTLNDNGNFGSYQTSFNNILTTTSNSSSIISDITSRINTFLANNNLTNLNDRNCVVLTCSGRASDSITLFFTFSNCSYPNNVNDLGYLSLYLNNGFYTFGCYGSSNDKIYSFEFQLKSYGVYNTYSQILNVNETIGNRNILGYSTITYNNDLTLYYMNSMACCGVPSARVSYPKSSNALNYYMILQDANGNFQISEPEPSGDVTPSGDDGGGGTVTPSGDSGLNIDYSPILGDINNNITNQGQNIVNQISGDTQKIIDNQNKNAEQVHNDLTNYDIDDGHEDVSNLINNIQDTLSGDLSNSEIFGALEESERGFLNLISGQAEDFEIHWNDVFYQNVKLIPAGQVNFSAMCRENSALGNIKEKLNIILSALCALALIKYLYNLLLATLGIDNPYLYDNNSDSDYIKTVDKNTGVTTFSGVDKDGTRWHYSYNPKKGGKKK